MKKQPEKRAVLTGGLGVALLALFLVVSGILVWQFRLFEPRYARLVYRLQTAKRAEDRAAAARQLGKMGAAARPAAPALVAALRDDRQYITQTLVIFPREHYVRMDVFEALKAIRGEETVEAVVDALEKSSRKAGQEGNWDWSYEPMLGQLLAELGPEALPAAERTLAAIDGCNDGEVIKQVVFAVQSMNIPPGSAAAEKALKVLPQFCFHADGTGRRAASILHRLAPDDEQVLELYVRSMLSGAPPAGAGAVPMNEKTIPLVLLGLADGTRNSALIQLASGEIEKVLPYLQTALRSPEPKIRSGAAEALAMFGERAAKAEPEIAPLLADEAPAVRVAAATALWNCAHNAEAALPELVAAIEGNKAVPRETARKFLNERGPKDAWAAPALAGFISSAHKKAERLAALEALGKIGPSAAAELPALLECLKDEDAEIQRAAARAVAAVERK